MPAGPLPRALAALLILLALLAFAPAAPAAGPPKDDHGSHGGDGGHGKHHDPVPPDELQDTHVHVEGQGHFWVFFEMLFGDPKGITLLVIDLGFYRFYLTKFMILELIAAGLILAIYLPLANAIKDGALPKGRWWNFFEVLLVFIRDTVARPSFPEPHHHGDKADEVHAKAHAHETQILAPDHGLGEAPPDYVLGGHTADRYVPFLWTLFLFVLFCNLLGMFPLLGSPTASIWVTGGLALIAYVAIHFIVVQKTGVAGLLKTMWPVVEMPPGLAFKIMGWGITLLLAVIEFVGLIIKAFVLAVRLFANMFAGHMVLANILIFIYIVGKAFGPGALWGGVTVASVAGVVALSLLELFVAFLQAYIFTFLTALFMGMQLAHAEHH
jgi:F-type H+-transporting ATPase subunit a